MTQPHILNGTVYGAERDPGDYRVIGELSDPYPELQQHISGSSTYWRGYIYARDIPEGCVSLELNHVWIGWHDKFLRVSGWSHGSNVDPTSRRWRFECSQCHDVGAAVFDYHHRVVLPIIEPSPPRPEEEWLDAERARAIRELVGAGRRPHVQAPNRRGDLVSFDPWAPEFMEVQP